MDKNKKLNILSLFDGMSCGQIALKELGIEVGTYFASEIKDVGIKVTQDNFPNTIQIGDVRKVTYKDGILYTENGEFETDIDMVCFGSPCQSYSIACKTHARVGLKDENKSGLFVEAYRILQEINPKFYFMENVTSMKDSDKQIISEMMGGQPYRINANKVSPSLRNRYYWTNLKPDMQLIDNNVKLNEIIENGYSDRDKARCLLVSDSRPLTTPVKMFHRYYSTGFTTLIFKDKEHYNACVNEYERLSGGKNKLKASDLDDYKGSIFDGVRYMNQNELETCQCVPQGYTKCLNRNQAADVLGDGWNINIIKLFFQDLIEK